MSLVGLIFFAVCIVALVCAWRSKPRVLDADDPVCVNCGYDLRASKERCPECGMPIKANERHIALRDDWPADAISPRIPHPNETPFCLYMTDIEWEARALREQLEVRGVAAQVADRPVIVDIASYTGQLKSVGSFRVMIWSGDTDLAAAIKSKLIPDRLKTDSSLLAASASTPAESEDHAGNCRQK